MTRTSFLVKAAVSLLSLNTFVSAAPLENEADWLVASDRIAKRSEDSHELVKRVTPRPAMPGQPSNCDMWKFVLPGDNCDSIIKKYAKAGLNSDLLEKYNPTAVVCPSATPRFYVCVRTEGQPTAAPSTSSKTSSSASSSSKNDSSPTTSASKTSSSSSSKSDSSSTTSSTKASSTSSSKGSSTSSSKGSSKTSSSDSSDSDDGPSAAAKEGPSGTATAVNPSGTFIIGAGDGNCVERQNINDLQSKFPDVFNLLVLALAQIMNANSTDPFSYFGLAGIHGAPYVPWPDPKETGDFNTKWGYCTHRSVIFALWHRPYMLALEQTLYYAAINIANTFSGSDKTKYRNAAKQVRWPYWDWAVATPGQQSHLPKCVMTPEISVMQPDKNGKAVKATITNPFYGYKFKGTENSFLTKPFAGGLEASNRRPKTSLGSSQDQITDTTMESGFITRRKKAYDLLSTNSTYNDFSNSLENIHNDVHVQIGGPGLMAYIPYAAFEPMFWLHHNNIDRFLAMWQAANPGEYLEPDDAVATFRRFVKPGDQDDLNTPFYPWKHKDGSDWTGNDVKDVKAIFKYGYGYPEVPCSMSGASDEELDKFATTQINDLYQADVQPDDGPATKLKERASSDNVTEWDINIFVDQAELPGTFAIYVFMGQPPSDISKWDGSPQKLSTLALLGTPGVTKESRVQAATIPLRPMMEKKGMKGDDPKAAQWLDDNLVWTCLNTDTSGVQKLVDVKSMKTLRVAITNKQVIPAKSKNDKPQVGALVIDTSATKSKGNIGGVASLDQLTNPPRLDGKKKAIRPGTMKIIAHRGAAGAKGAKPAAKGAAKPAAKGSTSKAGSGSAKPAAKVSKFTKAKAAPKKGN
ncbi:Tyrosinase [Arthrobotrys entomopaga]|nr:Tyrosinase [Arthrobotrys entomopaga]